jgi:hypothetical protein
MADSPRNVHWRLPYFGESIPRRGLVFYPFTMASVELGFACLPGKRVACRYSRANPACGRQPSRKAAGFARLGNHALSIEMHDGPGFLGLSRALWVYLTIFLAVRSISII